MGRNETQDCPGPSSLPTQPPGPAWPPHPPDGSHLRRVKIDIFGTAMLVPRDRRLVIEALLDVQSSQLILRGKDHQQGPARPLHATRPQPPSPSRRPGQRGDRARRGPAASPRPPLPSSAPGERWDTGTAAPPSPARPPTHNPGDGPLTPSRRRGRRAVPGASSPPAPHPASAPHLLLLGVLRVDVGRAEARALERTVLVAEDAEGRHPEPAGGQRRPGHNKGRRRMRTAPERPERGAGVTGGAEGSRSGPSRAEEGRRDPSAAGRARAGPRKGGKCRRGSGRGARRPLADEGTGRTVARRGTTAPRAGGGGR